MTDTPNTPPRDASVTGLPRNATLTGCMKCCPEHQEGWEGLLAAEREASRNALLLERKQHEEQVAKIVEIRDDRLRLYREEIKNRDIAIDQRDVQIAAQDERIAELTRKLRGMLADRSAARAEAAALRSSALSDAARVGRLARENEALVSALQSTVEQTAYQYIRPTTKRQRRDFRQACKEVAEQLLLRAASADEKGEPR